MLKELFDAICQKQSEATRPEKLNIVDAFHQRYLIDGKEMRIGIPPKIRNHTVSTLDDMIRAVKHYGGKESPGTLWHDTARVIFVMDDADRRETITLPLVMSDHWQIVSKLPQAMTQRDFVRILRHDLYGCVPDTLLPAIAKIEVATSSGQKNEINPGRERGTREFAVDLANSGEIPEHFVIGLTVYANAGLRIHHSVAMSLDYTLPPAQVTFRVQPMPDQLEIAMQGAHAALHEILSEAVDIPVFSGTP